MMFRQTTTAYKIPNVRPRTLLRLLLLCLCVTAHAKNPWHHLAPGLDYRDLRTEDMPTWAHVHVFRLDLTQYKLSLTTATDLAQPNASIDDLGHHNNALIAINGGFFDHNYRPLGLRIRESRQYNPFKPISWWGVFYIQEQKPYIRSAHDFNKHRTDLPIEFAIQSGPRLLIQGLIPPLKAGRDERTALGMNKQGHVLLVITENSPMTTSALAKIMKFPPLRCLDALNLDGGSSTQLYAHIGTFKKHVYGFSRLSDAVTISTRET